MRDSETITFFIGIVVATIIWLICTADWKGTWECVEYKHTSITEGYCLIQRYRRAGEVFESDSK